MYQVLKEVLSMCRSQQGHCDGLPYRGTVQNLESGLNNGLNH